MLKVSNQVNPNGGMIRNQYNNIPPPIEEGIGMNMYQPKTVYKETTYSTTINPKYSPQQNTDKWVGTPYEGHRISMDQIENKTLIVPPADRIKGTLKVDMPWLSNNNETNLTPIVIGGAVLVTLYFLFFKKSAY